MSITRYLRRRLDAAGADDGFSLMEGIVAALILAIATAITASLLIQVAGLTRNNGERSAAANLASTKLERVRQLQATAIPDGRVTTAETVGNTTYTVHQDSTFLTSGGATNACGGTGSLAYKRVTVTVEWPGMGATKPVQSETLRALGFDASSGGLDNTKGALGVLVVDADGKPAAGAQVTVRRGSTGGTAEPVQTTGADGCVVFTGLQSGSNYYSSAVKAGSVAVDSGPLVSDTGNGIEASGLAKSTLTLAPAGTLSVDYTAPTGSVMPAQLPFSLQHPQWSFPRDYSTGLPCPNGSDQACLQSGGKAVSPLYPGAYTVSFDGVQLGRNTAVPAGGSVTETIDLGAVSISSAAGGTVYADGDGNTALNDVIVLGTVPAGGTLQVALPPGTWNLGSSTGGAAVVTVTASNTTAVTL